MSCKHEIENLEPVLTGQVFRGLDEYKIICLACLSEVIIEDYGIESGK